MSFVDVAWQPPWRCRATPADCSFSYKGPGTLYWIHLGPRRGTEALLGEGRVAPQVSGRFRGLETGLCPLGVEKEEYDAGAVDIWTKVFEMLV